MDAQTVALLEAEAQQKIAELKAAREALRLGQSETTQRYVKLICETKQAMDEAEARRIELRKQLHEHTKAAKAAGANMSTIAQEAGVTRQAIHQWSES